MMKGSYIRNKHTREVHKLEIGDFEDCSKLSSVKVFSPDMSHSYWVDKADYELCSLEHTQLGFIVNREV